MLALLVNIDLRCRKFLKESLLVSGSDVFHLASSAEVISIMNSFKVDAIIFGEEIYEGEIYELSKFIKEKNSNLQFLVFDKKEIEWNKELHHKINHSNKVLSYSTEHPFELLS